MRSFILIILICLFSSDGYAHVFDPLLENELHNVFIKLGIPTVIILIFLIIIVILYNSKLKSSIERRTKDLLNSNRKIELDRLRTEYILKLVQTSWNTEDELTQAALEMCVSLTDSEVGYFHFVNQDSNPPTINLHTWSKNTYHKCAINKMSEYPLDHAGIWADGIRNNHPCIHNKVPNGGWNYPEGHFPLYRHMNVPIQKGLGRDDNIVAIIGVGNKNIEYTIEDVNQLQIFMESVWSVFKQKKYEEELKDNRLKLDAIFNNHFQMSGLLDTDGKFIMVNDTAIRFVGAMREDIVGQYMWETPWFSHDPIEQDKLKTAIKRASSGNFIRYETTHTTAGGDFRTIDFSIKPIMDDNGFNVQYLLPEGRDITDHKFKELELVKSERMLKMSQRIAGLGHWEHDIINNVVVWSDEIYRIFDLDPSIFTPTYNNYFMKTHPDDIEFVKSEYEKHLKYDNVFDIFHRLLINDTEIRYIHQKCRTDRNEEGTAIRSVGICQDVTSRFLAEQLLEQNIKEKETAIYQLHQAHKLEAIGQLAGGIAHDFNNILGIIMGNSELARDELLENGISGKYIDNILSASHRAKELVQQILIYSRQAEKDIQPLMPHILIKETVKLLKSSMPSSIEFKLDIAKCGTVIMDPTHLRQIIVNLCTNSFHSIIDTNDDSSGTINITLSKLEITVDDKNVKIRDAEPGPYVHLSITDDGCGIPKSNIDKVFEPYFTTKHKEQGTGLGLSIVYSLIQSYGGFVSIYSELGIGTTINIYIPRIISNTDEHKMIDEFIEVSKGNYELCLVVDDELQISDVISKILLKLNYQVEVFNDSPSALEAIIKDCSKYDFMITDMTMPTMSGLELSRRVLIECPNFPIILCTGFSDIRNLEKAKELGVKEYVMKPVLMQSLAVAIEKALK